MLHLGDLWIQYLAHLLTVKFFRFDYWEDLQNQKDKWARIKKEEAYFNKEERDLH